MFQDSCLAKNELIINVAGSLESHAKIFRNPAIHFYCVMGSAFIYDKQLDENDLIPRSFSCARFEEKSSGEKVHLFGSR